MMSTWFYPSLDGEQCGLLAEPSKTQFMISCALMGWLLLCYIPQWARIISRKSAEGISTYYMLLGALSGVCAVGNIMMIPSSAVEIGCCSSNDRFSCISGLLGMFQVIFGIVCFWIVLCMYVYYSEEEALDRIPHQHKTVNDERPFRRARHAVRVLLVSNSFALLIFFISAIILRYFPKASEMWADLLGIALAVGACMQWLPQIVTTWQLGHLGSLSPISLCLMAPYTWIFGINMIMRVGLSGWSAWIVYVLVGTMQLVLIGFATMFAVRGRNASTNDMDCHKRSMTERVFPERKCSEISQISLATVVDESCPLLADIK